MSHLPLRFSRDEAGFGFAFDDAMLAVRTRKLFLLCLKGQVDPDSDLYSVELAFAELVGNVVKHAPGPLEIRLNWIDRGARLEVADHGPGYQLMPTLPPDASEEAHRGLFMVASYGEELRVDRYDNRTVTSVTLPLRRSTAAT